jgi:hypothetical protein
MIKYFVIILLSMTTSFYANAQSCPSNAPLLCSGSPVNGDYCCGAGDGGRTDVCCLNNDAAHACSINGQCTVDDGGGGSDNGGGGGGGNVSGDNEICNDFYAEGCDSAEACANSNGEAWYDVDGRRFYCDGTSCDTAAQDAFDFCSSKKFGCSSAGYYPVSIIALLGIAVVMRKKKLMSR